MKRRFAYSYESNRRISEGQYSRKYDARHGGTVWGVVSGNDFDATEINATVYRDFATGVQSFQGEGRYYRREVQSVVGTDSHYLSNEVQTSSISLSERNDRVAETEVKTTFDTSRANPTISVDYWTKTTVDSRYEYAYDYVAGTAFGYHGEHETREETSRSEKETNYYKRATSSGDYETSWSSWSADGSGERSCDYIDYDGQETFERIYDESYDFDFDGLWIRYGDGTFARVPIVVENDVDGSFTTIRIDEDNETHTNTQYLTSPISTTSFSSQFDVEGYFEEELSFILAQVDGYAAANFGVAECQSGYSFTPDHIVLPDSNSFSKTIARYDFDLTNLSTSFGDFPESPSARDLSEVGIIKPYDDQTLQNLLPQSEKDRVVSQIRAEIAAKYSDTISTTGDFWDLLVRACEFVYDFLTTDESMDLAEKTFDDMEATGASFATSFLVAAAVYVADQVGVRSVADSWEGEDLETGRTLSAGERWKEGILGSISLITTAMGGLGQVKNVIRATGRCASVSRYFTNCCFTGDVEVLRYVEYSVEVPTLESEGGVTVNVKQVDESNNDLSESVDATSCGVDVDERDTAPEYVVAALGDSDSNASSLTSFLLYLSVVGAAAYAADKNRDRNRVFAQYRSTEEEDDPDLNDWSLLAIAQNQPTGSEVSDDALESGCNGVELICASSSAKTDKKLTRKTKRSTLPYASVCVLPLVILCAMLFVVFDAFAPHRETKIATLSELQTAKETVEQSFAAEPIKETLNEENNAEEDAVVNDDEIVFDANLENDQEEPSYLQSVQAAPLVATRSVEIEPCRISDIGVGDRLPGENPQGNDGSDVIEFLLQPHNVYSLRYEKEDGSFCNIKLLRPENWLENVETQLRRVSDGKVLDEIDLQLLDFLPFASTQDCELEAWLDLEELGCVGWATVTDVDDSFEYREGVGNLVTGTFEHEVGEVVDLQLEGQDKPIGVTTTHPFWSADREDFVTVGELFEGERILLYNGETKRVVQKLPRPGPQTVYNLEVFGEHVYHVTPDGALVHNFCKPKRAVIINKHLANKIHPKTKIKYDADAMPVFDSKGSVWIKLTGSRRRDRKLADEAFYQANKNLFNNAKEVAEYRRRMKYVWHHARDGEMQLVEEYYHKYTPHTGWYAREKYIKAGLLF